MAKEYLSTVVQYGLYLGIIGGSVSMVTGYAIKSLLHTFWLISK